MMNTWALVMAGGQGTRLWPLSRKENPKQFLTLFGKKSLIENTVERVSKFVPQKRILIITGADCVKRVRKLFPKIPKHQIIGEPVGRNTAATIGLAAAIIQKQDPDAVLCAFPADHVILNHKEFVRCLRIATKWAAKGNHHVVFGVKPTFPSTAYGYLEIGQKVPGSGLFVAKRYIEKPPYKKALQFVKKKTFLWQSGIFVFRADTILESFRKFLPVHHKALSIIAQSFDKNLTLPRADLFKKIPSISIDYGIMEKIDKSYIVPARFDWNDIGSWNALESVWQKDGQKNAYFGRLLAHNARKNLVYSQKRLVALLGVDDLAVIDSEDAVLICPKLRAEEVKRLIPRLVD